MTVSLNPEQAVAFDQLVAYAKAHKRASSGNAYDFGIDDGLGGFSDPVIRQIDPFVLSGLAGTGKTTVVGAFIRSLVADHGYAPERIAVVAYTGKATSVLNKKLGVDCPVVATTIHRFLYTMPIDAVQIISKKIDEIEHTIDASTFVNGVTKAMDGTNVSLASLQEERDVLLSELQLVSRKGGLRFQRQPVTLINMNYDVVLVDEASMVDDEIADHLAQTGLPIIYVGDGNQLPPVGKPFGVDLTHPDAKLVTIMRQAGDSGIIPVAHQILKLKALPKTIDSSLPGVKRVSGTNPLPHIGPDGEIPQFVTFFNNTRHGINHTIRKYVKKVDVSDPHCYLPEIGEYVMLDANLPEKRLMKGDILKVLSISFSDDGGVSETTTSTFMDEAAAGGYYKAYAKLEDAYGGHHELCLFLNDLMLSMKHPKGLNPQDVNDKREINRRVHGSVPVMFPYAITCYKAQGSEWDKVVVINEAPRDKGVYLQYVYTAVTRARSSLTIAG